MTEVTWQERYPNRCYFYPGRDCPGWQPLQSCAIVCQRFKFQEAVGIRKKSGVIQASEELLEESQIQDFAERLEKLASGEMKIMPREVKRHRCFFCWLVSKLPGHYRCPHGVLICEQCEDARD